MFGFLRFFTFSVKRGIQGLRRNLLMSLAATATMLLMLLLLAGFFLIQSGLTAAVAYVEQKVEVVADLVDTPGAEDALTVHAAAAAAELSRMSAVKSVVFISKQAALDQFRARLKERGEPDLTGFVDRNPLPASLEVKLVDPNQFAGVVENLRAKDRVVQRVVEVQQYVERLSTVTGVLRTGGIVLLVLVGFVALFIIVNTIRLAVVARREEIEIMRLVGASDAFIRWPFIFEGAFVGLLGAALTILILIGLAGPVGEFMASFFLVLPIQLGNLGRDVAIVVVSVGLGLGVLGSWLSVRSYLTR